MIQPRLNAKFLTVFALTAVMIAGAFALNSCGSSNNGSTTTSYIGAGSQWEVTLNSNGNTFVITHAPSVGGTTDLTVNGTYVSESTGFLQLTVTSSSGAGSGGITAPAAGTLLNALNIPGLVFLVSPVGQTNGNITAMIPTGNCPSGALNLNWVQLKTPSGFSYGSSDVFGIFNFSTAGVALVANQYIVEPPFTGSAPTTVGTGTCSGGTVSITNADLFLTSGGGAIVHANTSGEGSGNDQIFFALPQTAGPVTVTSLAGNYAGLAFATNTGGGFNTQDFPLSMTLAVSGSNVTGSAYQLTDITTGAHGTGAGTGANIVINADGNSNGFVTGTIDTSNPAGGGAAKGFACEVLPAGTQLLGLPAINNTILACVGVDQNQNFLSAIFVSH